VLGKVNPRALWHVSTARCAHEVSSGGHVRYSYSPPGSERNGLGPSCSLSCTCDHKVRCEVMRHGDGLGEIVFFDDEQTSATLGERVGYCPGCQERLSIANLRP